MGLDPSIPLSANQPKAPDLIGQAMQAYTLKSAMMQSQQAEQQMKTQQALRTVLSQPDAFDVDEAGIPIPKPETMKALAQVDPMAAQKLGESTWRMRNERSQIQAQERDKMLKVASPVAVGLMSEYEQLKKTDPTGADEAIKPKIDAALAQLKAQGLKVPPTMTIDEVKNFALQSQEYQKRVLGPTPAEQERSKPPFVRELEAAGFKQGTPEFKREMDKRIAKETTPPKTTVNVGGASATKNPLGDDPNFWYEYYDKTKQLPPMAWGAAGNPTREAFLKGFPEWKKKQGGSASDTAATQASFKADAGALNAVTKDLNTFEPYKKMLDTNADIAIQLGQKIRQTLPVAVNKPLNWVRQNYGDNPDVAEFLAQMRFVQTEAARVINNPRIVGQLTDESRKEMDQVITGNAPIDVVERVLTRLKTDGNNRFNAMRSQQTEIVSKMKGSKDHTKEDKPTPKKPLSAFQN